METNYSSLANHQLINLANKNRVTDQELNAEWYNRGGLNYPYELNISGNIINSVLGEVISDDQCDRLILKQANRVRDRMKQKREEMGLDY